MFMLYICYFQSVLKGNQRLYVSHKSRKLCTQKHTYTYMYVYFPFFWNQWVKLLIFFKFKFLLYCFPAVWSWPIDLHLKVINKMRILIEKKKSTSKGYILYGSIYVVFMKRQNYKWQISGCQWLRERGRHSRQRWGLGGGYILCLYCGCGYAHLSVY